MREYKSGPRYFVRRDPSISPPFNWVIVDASGKPALWRTHPKVGQVPMGFRSAAIAQAAADRLEREEG